MQASSGFDPVDFNLVVLVSFRWRTLLSRSSFSRLCSACVRTMHPAYALAPHKLCCLDVGKAKMIASAVTAMWLVASQAGFDPVPVSLLLCSLTSWFLRHRDRHHLTHDV